MTDVRTVNVRDWENGLLMGSFTATMSHAHGGRWTWAEVELRNLRAQLTCQECGGISPVKQLYGNGFPMGDFMTVRHLDGCARGLWWATLFAEVAPELLETP